MNYLFECSGCRQKYPVDRKTLEAFITPHLRHKLEKREAEVNVTEAIAHFKSACPRCKPNDEYHVKLDMVFKKHS